MRYLVSGLEYEPPETVDLPRMMNAVALDMDRTDLPA